MVLTIRVECSSGMLIYLGLGWEVVLEGTVIVYQPSFSEGCLHLPFLKTDDLVCLLSVALS